MRWTLQRLGRSGRAGTRALRSLLDDRGPIYTPTDSAVETRVRSLLRESGLPEPVVQLEVRAGGVALARVDLAYPAARVAIEADGYRFHTHRADWQRERRVQNALTTRGWLVVRVTWEDVERRPREVVAQVRAALALRVT
jgi:very-short-patch-repair endonuclease